MHLGKFYYKGKSTHYGWASFAPHIIGDKILHKANGPAIEWDNGTREWYKDGKLHREDGPAIEWNYGTREWHIDGKLHRLDGPAYHSVTGEKIYCVLGIEIEPEIFFKIYSTIDPLELVVFLLDSCEGVRFLAQYQLDLLERSTTID